MVERGWRRVVYLLRRRRQACILSRTEPSGGQISEGGIGAERGWMRTLLAAIFNKKSEGKAGGKEREVMDKESEYQDTTHLDSYHPHSHG